MALKRKLCSDCWCSGSTYRNLDHKRFITEPGSKDVFQERYFNNQYEDNDPGVKEDCNIPHKEYEDDLADEEDYMLYIEARDAEPETHNDHVDRRHDLEQVDDEIEDEDSGHYSDFDEWLRPESQYIDDFGDKEPSQELEAYQTLKEKDYNSDADSNTVNKHDPDKSQRRNTVSNEHDEIMILEHIIAFSEEDRNVVVFNNMAEFRDFIRNRLQDDVSVSQLHEKIKRLKDKYHKNVKRTEHGVPSFSDPHEETLFFLSKNIWGTDGEVKEPERLEIRWELYPRLSELLKMEEFASGSLPVSRSDHIKEMLSYIDCSKAEQLEEKCRKLQVAETEVKLMRAQLIEEQTRLVLDAIKS